MTRSIFLLAAALCLIGSAAAAETLTLDDCLQLVRKQNPTLLEAASKPRLAATAEDATRSAYRPRVELNAGYTAQQAPQQVLIGGLSEPTQDRTYPHASLTVDQLLYDFGRTAGRVGAAEAARRAASFTYTSTEQDFLLQAVAAYYRVLSSTALLQAARDEVTQTETHLRVGQALYDQGVVTRNDVLQAVVRLAASRQQVLAREGEVENAWLDLNYLTGRPAESRSELVAESPPPADSEPDNASLEDRPDLLAQSEKVSRAREELRQVNGSFWPELYAHLGADYVDNSHVQEQTIYSATLGLRFTLYDGSARDARLSQAQETLRKERRHLTDLQERARLAEQTARNDARVAAQQISVAQTAISQAEENLRINQDRYREQVGTATEVLDAETLLTQARTDLARSQFNYQVAVARIRYAAGKL